MHLRNTTIVMIVTAIYGLLAGFAWGNILGEHSSFQLKDWQTLVSAMIAFGGVALAYVGVRGTQRISVLIKEQERIDDLLPGLRQVDETLGIPRFILSSSRPGRYYQALGLLESTFEVQERESLQDAVIRRMPLADEHVKFEVSNKIFELKSHALVLKIGHEEVLRCEKEVAEINQFAPSARQGVIETARHARDNYTRDEEKMNKFSRSLDAFALSVKQRISRAEARNEIIRRSIDKFFEQES